MRYAQCNSGTAAWPPATLPRFQETRRDRHSVSRLGHHHPAAGGPPRVPERHDARGTERHIARRHEPR
jgi:hypothetical protein